MYTPKYTLSSKLLTNVNEIERLYGRLEAITVPSSLLLNLERDNLVQSSFASNSIEGNPLSEAEVTNLLLNDRVPVNRDEKEVVNYFHLLKQMDKNVQNKDLSIDIILRYHNELMNGVNNEIKGKIRNIPVIVGKRNYNNELYIKHNPPFHTETSIKTALNDLAEYISKSEDIPLIKVGIYHHQFVFIHPFVDGNGRVCRLTTAFIFLKYNYQINKYFVLDDYYDIDRDQYSDMLHSADSGDKTQWLEYFTDGVKFSLQSSIGKIESGLQKLTFDTRPTAREQDVLKLLQQYKEMNSNDIVKEFQISRQQAVNLLKGLTEKGFIQKQGSTKNSYYILKS
ncbi:MAG TPA: Fic family protein [Candidatus Woesebacteria bacterium]|nr:Fic family protein [Candidatus Woesebacteria bacterium]